MPVFGPTRAALAAAAARGADILPSLRLVLTAEALTAPPSPRALELNAELDALCAAVRELADCPWISHTSGSLPRDFFNQYFQEHGLSFQPDIELATTDMILPAVRYNLGIGFIPAEFATEDLRQGTVFEIAVEEKLPQRSIQLVYDTEYPQSVASKTFLEFLFR